MGESPEKDSFETSLKKLEKIALELDHGELPLEQYIAKYEEGILCLNQCYAMLSQAQKKIVLLKKKSDGILQENSFDDYLKKASEEKS